MMCLASKVISVLFVHVLSLLKFSPYEWFGMFNKYDILSGVGKVVRAIVC